MFSKVRITKLYGKYNYEIDLSNKCTIIFGENGTGKTTVLELLNLLSGGQQNYFKLLKFPFERIDIFYDNTEDPVTIFEEDILIKKDEIKALTREEQILLQVSLEVSYEEDSVILRDSAEIEYNKYLSNFPDSEFRLLVRETYFDKLDFNDFSFDLYRWNFERGLLNFVSKKIKKYYEVYEEILSVREVKKLQTIQVERFSSVKNIVFIEKAVLSSLMRSPVLYEIPVEQENPFGFIWVRKNKFDKEIDGTVIGLLARTKAKAGHLLELYKDLEGIYPAAKNYVELCEYNETIDINKMANVYYFTRDDYLQFNQSASSYLYKHAFNSLNPLNMTEEEIRNYYYKNEKFLKEEVGPLFVKGHPFLQYSMAQSLPRYITRIDELLIEFLAECGDLISSKRNKILSTIEVELNKYLYQKRVEIKPSGVYIFSITGESLKLNSLSSGEKKLVNLFFRAAFSKSKVMIIDEPEISLSIIWQEKLVQSLITINPNIKYIIATHSPYISSNEDTFKYLVPLRNFKVLSNE